MYMAQHACWGKNNTLLMPETAKGYYSAFKCYLVWKFENEGVPKPLQPDRWRKYLKSMMSKKQQTHHAEGKEMNNPKKMISDNHRKGICKICIWNGNTKSATFMAFNASLYTFAARTVESSALRKSMMNIKSEVNEQRNMPVLSTKICRTKTGVSYKDIRSYPCRDDFLLDYHFALAYCLILNKHTFRNKDFIFPDFERELNYEKSDAKKDSQTSLLYKRYSECLIECSKEYGNTVCTDDDEFREEYLDCLVTLLSVLRGHGNKKRAVNKLAENLEMQIFSFRCGWLVQNLHTVFDYLFGTNKKDGKMFFRKMIKFCHYMLYYAMITFFVINV